jgi:hypothetical protein
MIIAFKISVTVLLLLSFRRQIFLSTRRRSIDPWQRLVLFLCGLKHSKPEWIQFLEYNPPKSLPDSIWRFLLVLSP